MSATGEPCLVCAVNPPVPGCSGCGGTGYVRPICGADPARPTEAGSACPQCLASLDYSDAPGDDVLTHIRYDDSTDATAIEDPSGLMRLLWRDGQPPRFEHRCDRGERGVIICAPTLHPDHVISGTRDKPTVRPSVLCPDCGLHGFITDGAWT